MISACCNLSNSFSAIIPAIMPAMKKVMKVFPKKVAAVDAAMKVLPMKTLVKKRPSTSLNKKNLAALEQDPEQVSLSLDDKISQFEKKPGDINTWLARLSKQEREAVWKRFEYDRKAVPGAQEGYLQAACGKRSKEVKLDLLKAFLANHSSCKGPAMQQAFSSHGITVGTKTKESWRPFAYMSTYYGVAELFRRVKNGSILARKEAGEWEFKLVQNTSYRDDSDSGGFRATAQGKLSDEKFAELQSVAANRLGLSATEGAPMDKNLITFLQSKASTGAKNPLAIGSGDDGDNEEDPDLKEADKLTNANTIGKKAKERMASAIQLVQKVHDECQDNDMKNALQVHLKGLKKADSSKLKLEDVKDKLINAMHCIKKAKKMTPP